MFKQNTGFKTALIATGDAHLTHSIGKTNPKETILTVSEFCNRLHWLRDIVRHQGII
jgi:hypothetical protein